jgi:hypothetical protein
MSKFKEVLLPEDYVEDVKELKANLQGIGFPIPPDVEVLGTVIRHRGIALLNDLPDYRTHFEGRALSPQETNRDMYFTAEQRRRCSVGLGHVVAGVAFPQIAAVPMREWSTKRFLREINEETQTTKYPVFLEEEYFYPPEVRCDPRREQERQRAKDQSINRRIQAMLGSPPNVNCILRKENWNLIKLPPISNIYLRFIPIGIDMGSTLLDLGETFADSLVILRAEQLMAKK